MAFKASVAMRAKIKKHETGGVEARNSAGRRYLKLLPTGEPALTAYRCPAGVWTIGWGHTGADVFPGQSITRPQAEKLFQRDLAKFEKNVNAFIEGGAPTNQNQFDALLSFAYNVGEGALKKSTLLKHHRAGRYDKAAAQFGLWNKGKVRGKLTVMAGLTERRAEERALYMKACSKVVDMDDGTETDEFDENLSRRVTAEAPKGLGKSTTIGAAIAGGLPATGVAVDAATEIVSGAPEKVKKVPLTVDDLQMAQSSAVEMQYQAEGKDHFATMALVLGVIVMILSAYIIYKRFKERAEGVQ
jgi:lysozyme